jgi:hypothetical protein
MFKDVLLVQKRVLGPEHPSTLLTAKILAYLLEIQGKHADAFARDNLRAPQPVDLLKDGATVSICGVVSKPALNGQHAYVIRWNQTKHRYAIKTKDGAKMLLKRENITLVEAAAGGVNARGNTPLPSVTPGDSR